MIQGQQVKSVKLDSTTPMSALLSSHRLFVVVVGNLDLPLLYTSFSLSTFAVKVSHTHTHSHTHSYRGEKCGGYFFFAFFFSPTGELDVNLKLAELLRALPQISYRVFSLFSFSHSLSAHRYTEPEYVLWRASFHRPLTLELDGGRHFNSKFITVVAVNTSSKVPLHFDTHTHISHTFGT